MSQAIVVACNASYFTNVAHRFYRCPVAATWFANHVFQPADTTDFTSDYGVTRGYWGPSEAGPIWNRWFSDVDDHYAPAGTLSDASVHEIRQTVSRIASIMKGPFVSKNTKHAERLESLVECFPRARFIIMQRDPMDHAASLLRGWRRFAPNRDSWWSVKPRRWRDLRHLDERERTHLHILEVERDIVEAERTIGSERFMSVKYERLCKQPREVLMEIAEFAGVTLKNLYGVPERFEVSKSSGLDHNDQNGL